MKSIVTGKMKACNLFSFIINSDYDGFTFAGVDEDLAIDTLQDAVYN